MTKQKNSRVLLWTFLLIALIQMPHLAITPGIDLLATSIFPEKALQTIQTVMSLPNIISSVAGVLAALLIRYGISSKKTMVIVGLVMVSAVGAAAFFLNTEFWHLILLNTLIGAGMGTFIPTAQSIVFDTFDEKTRQFLSGVQFSFINAGGIVMSVLGGLLTTIVWYGGHLVLLVALPVAVVAAIVIPKDRPVKPEGGGRVKATKLPTDVYFYSAFILVFNLLFSVAAHNLATHLANGSIGDSATAGVATALMMAGGVVSGIAFPKLSAKLGDYLLGIAFSMMFIGYSVFNLFSTSLAATLIGMFICGASLSLFIPRCIFSVSNLTDPTNSATATMLIASVAPGIGGFISPIVMTNLTLALGGESTRFRYQFTGFVCLAVAAFLLLNNVRKKRRNNDLPCE